MISRRKFISTGVGLVGAASLSSVITSCEPHRTISGTLSGPNSALGHRLREGNFSAPIETVERDIVIIGGGIAGLSAARQLSSVGADYLMLEMENAVGGNSSFGRNSVSSYPLGAHYLTLPGVHDPELIKFLEECNVITGYDKGKPVYNEYHLCFDPKERLYIHNQWQEGLVPHQGVPPKDTDEINRFHSMMEQYKERIGADGKEAFCIPLNACSSDPEFLRLDKISFAQFLKDLNYQSPFLLWYVNYCCADDFGATIDNTSAWAGIHYFACHKGVAANAPSDSILTWPEGNGWLVTQLKKVSETNTLSHVLVHSVKPHQRNVEIDYFDAQQNVSKRIKAEKVIIATPQFISQRILSPYIDRELNYQSFEYAPWMVANLTLTGNWDTKRGERLSWDNVIYGSSSLGYVNANHQQVEQHSDKKVITYYSPLIANQPAHERKLAYSKGYKDWYNHILKDLQIPHREIESQLQSLDVWIWGHGMIRPSVGFITGRDRQQALKDIEGRILFAHSDLSGISIFEEAFFHGTQAAKKVLS